MNRVQMWSRGSSFVSDPIQERSRATKYQVSPDLQHVLFAFEVKAVSSAPSRPLTPPRAPTGLSSSSQL